MFREMRRKNQALNHEECIDILNRINTGVLAVSGDDDYPYAVPLNFVHSNNKIFFHCAKQGHKTDAIKNNNKVSFCVIDKDDVVPEEYTTYFKSVIVFGKANIIQCEKQKMQAIDMLAKKYAPMHDETRRQEAIKKGCNYMDMIEIEILHISGKQSKKLI